MPRKMLLLLGSVGSMCLAGCSAGSADFPESGYAPEQGVSVVSQTDNLTGCKGKASSTIPESGNYILTTFGNGTHDDGIMSCGQYTKHGSWYYAASRQRYGCGSRIRIEAKGKCVVAETDDYGPDVCVEKAAGKPIMDVSPLVAKHLFGVTGAGYSDKLAVYVTEVATSTPLGPCQAPATVCSPGETRCNSAGTSVETCKADGSGFALSKACAPDPCLNGACDICADHCGNGQCDCGESASSCPSDCQSACTPSWSCGAWSSCDCAGQQTRSCTDANACGSAAGEPSGSQACDPCSGGESTCPQCSAGCQYGETGEHNDPCDGIAGETWRCVTSQKLGTTVSQVCRDSDQDGHFNWVSFHTDPIDCAACCGAYVSGCS